jgi:CRP/FNR family transcriptional regulator, anaerobic regulatory protein
MHTIVAQPNELPIRPLPQGSLPQHLRQRPKRTLAPLSRMSDHLPTLFEPRAVITTEGQGGLYRVLDGCVALYRSMRDGRRQIIDIIGPGRMIGPFGTGQGSCTAETLTYTTLERTSEAASQAHVAEQMMTSLDRARNHTLLLGRKTADEKVASAVIDLAGQFMLAQKSSAKRKTTTFTLYLTRADLGDWLGLTVETVSRCLNALKRDGLIAFEQTERITILKPELLCIRAGMPDRCFQ